MHQQYFQDKHIQSGFVNGPSLIHASHLNLTLSSLEVWGPSCHVDSMEYGFHADPMEYFFRNTTEDENIIYLTKNINSLRFVLYQVRVLCGIKSGQCVVSSPIYDLVY